MRLFNAATRINTRTKTQKESVKQICNSKKEGNQMNPEEKIRKLKTMPWQALFDLAVKYQVEEEELKGKEKDEVIRRLLLTDISEEEIKKVVDNYIYGNRVTFTLWGFSENLN